MLLLSASFIFSNNNKPLFQDLSDKNRESVEALALYPKETRLDILEAAKYPKVLGRMQNLQEKSAASFRALLRDFSREDQTVFYDLTRYPGLIEKLHAADGNDRKIQEALVVLPENQRGTAFRVVDANTLVIHQIYDQNQSVAAEAKALFADYPPAAQGAFWQLLDHPEVIEILNKDRRLTNRIGDRYRKDPAEVIREMDSLSVVVAENKEQEVKDWNETVAKDPEARAELQSAAKEYAEEYGYDDDYYDYSGGNYVITHYYYHPYSYWYGYPWWYDYPRWRPYPYWWDYSYGYYNPAYVVYMPSYQFTHWYFHHPWHHVHYNHLSTVFVNQYYGHRGSGSPFVYGVSEWQAGNKSLVTEDFLADKSNLPGRLNAYGLSKSEKMAGKPDPGVTLPKQDKLSGEKQAPYANEKAMKMTPERGNDPANNKAAKMTPERGNAPANNKAAKITPEQRKSPAMENRSVPAPKRESAKPVAPDRKSAPNPSRSKENSYSQLQKPQTARFNDNNFSRQQPAMRSEQRMTPMSQPRQVTPSRPPQQQHFNRPPVQQRDRNKNS